MFDVIPPLIKIIKNFISLIILIRLIAIHWCYIYIAESKNNCSKMYFRKGKLEYDIFISKNLTIIRFLTKA
jgi:hypothetical protein